MRRCLAHVFFIFLIFSSSHALAGPHYDEGLSLFNKGAYKKASKRLSKSFKKEPEVRSDAALLLSYCYEKMGKVTRAVGVLKKGGENDPDNWQILYRLGGLCDASGDYFTALSAYEKASSVKPNDLETAFRLGMAYDRTAQIEKALKIYRRLKQANSPHAKTLLDAIQGMD